MFNVHGGHLININGNLTLFEDILKKNQNYSHEYILACFEIEHILMRLTVLIKSYKTKSNIKFKGQKSCARGVND